MKPIKEERWLVAQFNPQDIDSFIKALNAMNAIHPAIGIVVALIGLLVALATGYNTVKTIFNTRANVDTKTSIDLLDTKIKAHQARMDSHAVSMESLEKKATEKIEAAANKVTDAIAMSTQLVQNQLNDIKKVSVEIHRRNEAQLSLIPKVQDAIENERKRVDEILKILTKGKGGS